MSIAVSAVVSPSRLLIGLTLMMSGGAVLIGLAVALGVAMQMPVAGVTPSSAVGWMRGMPGMLAALACIGAGVHAAARILRRRMHFRIDISETGQIHIKSLLPRHDRSVQVRQTTLQTPSGPLKLLPQSTLWSNLLALRLECELGHIHTLFVLPDTVSQTSFRMLSVACHWIAAHNIRAGSENT